MLHRRRYIRGTVLIGLALGMAGCGSARKPYLVIIPTYSYVRAGVAMEVTSSPLRTSEAGEVEFPRDEGLPRPASSPTPGL